MTRTVNLFEHQKISYEELGWTSGNPYLELLENLNDTSSDTLIEIGRHSLKATQYVGVLRVMDLTIQVLPKIDYDQRGSVDASPGSIPHKTAENSARDNLLHMLSYVEDIRIHKQTAAELRTLEQDWFELLIRFFAVELHKQLLQGPYRTYIREEEDLPVLRGKWLIAKQLATKPHVKDRT